MHSISYFYAVFINDDILCDHPYMTACLYTYLLITNSLLKMHFFIGWRRINVRERLGPFVVMSFSWGFWRSVCIKNAGNGQRTKNDLNRVGDERCRRPVVAANRVGRAPACFTVLISAPSQNWPRLTSNWPIYSERRIAPYTCSTRTNDIYDNETKQLPSMH